MLAVAVRVSTADYATYIGDAYTYQVTALTTDSIGNTVVTGTRQIVPATGGSFALTDIFVSRLDASENLTVLAILSGKKIDRANAIALDSAGNIYVAGTTTSSDFPLHHPLQSTPASFGDTVLEGTGFLVKLTSDGTVLYSTFLGGTTGPSSMNAVVADAQGNAYVTGETFASDYPHSTGLPAIGASPGLGAASAAFFAKISPTGDKILFAGGLGATARACGCCSSCFLSTLDNAAVAIALDPAGDAYVAGNANGTGLQTTPGVLRTDGLGAFVAKVNASGTSLGYVTLLGSANYFALGISANPGNLSRGIAVDSAGNAYIVGSTSDPDFPATDSAFQTKLSQPNTQATPLGPPPDAFVAKLNPTAGAMVWASFLGGMGADQANAIGVDARGDVWVSGTTQSSDFPVSDGVPGGSEFLVEFNPSGTAVSYGARLPANTVAAALAVDSSGVVHTGGSAGVISALTPAQTSSPRLVGLVNAAGGNVAGRIAPAEVISIYGLHLGPASPISATFSAAGFLPTTLGGVQVTINGTAAPLLYVSDTQINAIAPVELMGGATSSLNVMTDGASLPAFRLVVDPAIPEVFRHADLSAAAINQDNGVNSATNPAKSGSFVSIWVAGTGGTPGLADGQLQTAAEPACGCIIHDITQNKDIIPSYQGAAPGMVNGIVQVNFQVANPGDYYWLVTGNQLITSDAFSLFVSP